MNKFNIRPEKKNNSVIDFNLNRDMDVFTKKDKEPDVLNDREMFNHFSNEYEQVDMSNLKPHQSIGGMLSFSSHIQNNKKNLINNPYIQESNDKTHFHALNTISNVSSNMYASIKDDNISNNSNNSEGGYFMSKFSDYSSINNDKTNKLLKNDTVEEAILNSFDKIEQGIIIYEFDEYNKNISKKNFIMDVFTPFGLSYLWKSLILLSKNPSTDKLLKMLNIKKKEELTNDMKYFSDVFGDLANCHYTIPQTSGLINTNFIKKIEDIYKIKINAQSKNNYDKQNYFTNSENDKVTIYLKFKLELKIPQYYQPVIISDYLLGYNGNKIKFIKLTNVPCALTIDRTQNIVNLEIPLSHDFILGFSYNLSRENLTNSELLYNKIIEQKPINKIINNLIIPKINRNKKINYGKKFTEQLQQLHLGEITYGIMYNIDIISETELDIAIDNDSKNTNYNVSSSINEIKINHKCCFYVKNSQTINRILLMGLLNY